MKTQIKDNSKLSRQESEQSLLGVLRALFDADFYLNNNRDVKKSKLDPFTHFLEHGAKEGRSPHPLFDTSYYFDMAPDRDAIGDNPLLHFLSIGHSHGFNPHPLFDVVYYRQQAGELLGEDNPLVHYLTYGKELRLNPHPLFDTEFYLKNNMDAQKSEINPLLHFLRYGKARCLTPHPLFDARFYLSKYPGLKKLSINPLVHFAWRGARERRSPNANFDTKYYLRIIFPVVVDNPLLHYLQIGHDRKLPTIPFKQNNGWWLPESISQIFRTIGFSFFSFVHALSRSRIDVRKNYDHRFSVFKFWRMSVLRFWQGAGAQVKFSEPTYLTQPKRIEQPQSHINRIYRAPLAFIYLYLANVFKVQGYFADAEYILRKVEKHPLVCDLALYSLGDLFLIEATWAHEFKSYEESGIVLNPFARSKLFADSQTWHRRKFEEGLSILENALRINTQNTDAQWLLCYGYLSAGKYTKAMNLLDTYPGRVMEGAERNLLKARAMYSNNADAAVALRRQYLDNWSKKCHIANLQLVNIADLPPAALKEHISVIDQVKFAIESTVVRQGEKIDFKNSIEFDRGYVCRLNKAQVIPDYGMVIAEDRLLMRESAHIKSCHMAIFNPGIQEIVADQAFLCELKATEFGEQNCIYMGCNNNYYHWLIEELPRLGLIDRANIFTDAPILISDNASNWQYELLSMIGVEQDRLRRVNFRKPNYFTNLIMPSRLSRDMVAHPEAVSYIRRKLLPTQDLKPTAGKRIYISRDMAAGRSMLNQKNIVDQFKRANFQIVDPSKLSIKEQIELFCDADVIAGAGGAGLANIVFAPKGARVLSLSSSHILCETFTSIAAAVGQKSWWCTGLSYARAYPYWIWTNFDFEIDERDVSSCFEEIL